MPQRALSLVMPAYNEEALIATVVQAWFSELDRLGIDFVVRVYDDGSCDRTGEILERLACEDQRLVVTRQANRGHGPTVVRGYREASSEWILQVDADGELGPEGFEHFWQRREDFDFLVGYRQNRNSPVARRLLTGGSRLAVRALFGSGIRDVNSAFRLMRRSAIERFLPWVGDVFAPNLILSGLAIRAGLRTYEAPVRFTPRVAGQVSIGGWRVWRTAARSFWETARVSFSCRDGRQP
jgi:dolichol-phosphate mannosyltransferase